MCVAYAATHQVGMAAQNTCLHGEGRSFQTMKLGDHLVRVDKMKITMGFELKSERATEDQHQRSLQSVSSEG